MNQTLLSSPQDSERVKFRGSLTRSLIQTLLLLTFIPLFLMAGAAYLRAQTLLREQALFQMKNLLTSQVSELRAEFKAKSIRLDRLVRRTDFSSLLERATHANRKSPDFLSLRDEILRELRGLNVEEAEPAFSQFLVTDSTGSIEIASKAEWEGTSLTQTAIAEILKSGKPGVTALYDFSPLYPDQIVLLTIQPYKTPGGSLLGTVIGISEAPNLLAILQPIPSVQNSTTNSYYFVPPSTFVKADPYTRELFPFTPTPSQQAQLTAAFDSLITGQDSQPSLEFLNPEGKEAIAQAQWIPEINAGIVLEIDKSIIFGQLNSLVPFTLALLGISLIGTTLAIYVGANRVIRPILTLTQITRRFAEGNLDERAEIPNNNEIGFLAYSFNRMAEELSNLYRSLEQKVEERTRQIRTAAEIAQGITAAPQLEDLLNNTTRLIVERFGYYYAQIFLVDPSGKYAVLKAAYGPPAKDFLSQNYRLEVGPTSIIGWVATNNTPRVALDVSEDTVHLSHELLRETRSEVGVPITSAGHVFGVLDVQSVEAHAFDAETVTVLQTIANQIAAAIQNTSLVEATQINFQELERLYRASRLIARAQSQEQILEEINKALRGSPYISALLTAQGERLVLYAHHDPTGRLDMASLPREINIRPAEAFKILGGQSIFDLTSTRLPPSLISLPRAWGCSSFAYLPIMQGEKLQAMILLGTRTQTLTNAALQPYLNMVDLANIAFEKIGALRATEDRLRELNALMTIAQTISTASEASTLYPTLHEQIRRTIGDFSFTVTLYDEKANTISVPYSYEDGTIQSIEPFPLGEGLTSILLHTRQPLMIVEDTERRTLELGAKIAGRPAKSWMGAPMLLNNRAIGALIIQDLDREHAFTEEHLRFLTALASQVAGVIYNIRLLEESRQRTLQLQTAAEIARDISGSLNLDELLVKAVNFIRDRFSFYHAAVFLLDLSGEYAVIREATGEAGAQMKRAGHKLGVGSKSIVGYVASRGEPLTVNDTTRDPTYYANPLLPATRAETAIPLKVGERILGVLDVQSTQPYAFTEDNLRTLQILADQLAIAVVNTELFAETQEHLSEHRLLHHITTTAASGTTLEEALRSAVNGLQVTLGGDRVTILLADREQKFLEVKAAVGYSEEVNQVRVPIGSGVTGWVAAHRRPLRIDDVRNDPRYIEVSPNTRSELAIPLIYRNEVLGVLNVESEQVAAYTESDEEMLGTLGGSLAAIIANARLLEQIRAQAERERLLFEVTSKIRRSTDMQTILATTASELSRVVGARRTQIRINPLSANEPPQDEQPNGN
jgi:GAF domain-containing protein/HAMP domain-containing protein